MMMMIIMMMTRFPLKVNMRNCSNVCGHRYKRRGENVEKAGPS
jgi:hypothetical protein